MTRGFLSFFDVAFSRFICSGSGLKCLEGITRVVVTGLIDAFYFFQKRFLCVENNDFADESYGNKSISTFQSLLCFACCCCSSVS